MEILKISDVAKLLSVSNVDNIVHDIIKFERFHIKRRSLYDKRKKRKRSV